MTTETNTDTDISKDEELEDVTPAIHELSDEEIEKLPPSTGLIESEPSNETTDDDTEEVEESEDTTSSDDTKPDSDTTSDKTPDTSTDKESTQTVDYEAEYKKLTAPFRANGSDIKINNVDEAITLMQMGANYHQKMATLKPAMKAIKLLERNDLLDEGKLSFLIDVAKKDPAAIQKLIKESGIDLTEIDVDEDVNYTPKTTPVTDSEMALDEVLNRIESTPTYGRTLTVITKEWDTDSRTAVASNPHIIQVINEHIASGIYDKVMGEVKRVRTLGQLPVGVSDFEAYKQVGDIMNNQGLLGQQSVQPNAPVDTQVPNAQQKNEVNRDALRKAAGAPPAKKGQQTPVVKKNLLDISDEEFEKLPANAYIKV